ncbi:MAG: hypothetical protein ACHQF0_02625 [Chitinophagales bacterium]
MFIQTWNKYLPVIRILLKRSVNAEQTLDMNESDFHRAAGGKKVKFTFSFVLIRGRLNGAENPPPPLGKDLIAVLQQDDVTHKFLRRSELAFTMNSNSQLLIKNVTPAPEPELQADETIAEEEAKPGETPR